MKDKGRDTLHAVQQDTRERRAQEVELDIHDEQAGQYAIKRGIRVAFVSLAGSEEMLCSPVQLIELAKLLGVKEEYARKSVSESRTRSWYHDEGQEALHDGHVVRPVFESGAQALRGLVLLRPDGAAGRGRVLQGEPEDHEVHRNGQIRPEGHRWTGTSSR